MFILIYYGMGIFGLLDLRNTFDMNKTNMPLGKVVFAYEDQGRVHWSEEIGRPSSTQLKTN